MMQSQTQDGRILKTALDVTCRVKSCCDISAMLPYADSAWHRARSDIGPMLA